MLFKKSIDRKIGCLNCGHLMPDYLTKEDSVDAWVCLFVTVYDYDKKQIFNYVSSCGGDYKLDFVDKIKQLHPNSTIKFFVNKNVHDSVDYEYCEEDGNFYCINCDNKIEDNIKKNFGMQTGYNPEEERFDDLDDLLELSLEELNLIDRKFNYYVKTKINKEFILIHDSSLTKVFNIDKKFIDTFERKKHLLSFLNQQGEIKEINIIKINNLDDYIIPEG